MRPQISGQTERFAKWIHFWLLAAFLGALAFPSKLSFAQVQLGEIVQFRRSSGAVSSGKVVSILGTDVEVTWTEGNVPLTKRVPIDQLLLPLPLQPPPAQLLNQIEKANALVKNPIPKESTCPPSEAKKSQPEYRYKSGVKGEWWKNFQKYFEGRTFTRSSIRDNGNCAFTAMGRTREEYIQKLNSKLIAGSESEKNEIRLLLQNSFEAEKARIQQRLAQNEGVDSVLEERMAAIPTLSSVSDAKKFLNTVVSLNTYYANLDDIQLASQVFNINVLVVKSSGANSHELELALGSQSAFLTKTATETHYLFFDGTNHFDALNPKKIPK